MSADVFSLWVRVWAGSAGPGGLARTERAAGDRGCFAASTCTGPLNAGEDPFFLIFWKLTSVGM